MGISACGKTRFILSSKNVGNMKTVFIFSEVSNTKFCFRLRHNGSNGQQEDETDFHHLLALIYGDAIVVSEQKRNGLARGITTLGG